MKTLVTFVLFVDGIFGKEPDMRLISCSSLTHAIVQAPDGTFFNLTSTLPRDRLEALAEELVPVK